LTGLTLRGSGGGHEARERPKTTTLWAAGF